MVLSETIKRQPDSHALAWLRRTRSADVFISVLSIGEIERGIAQVKQANAGFAARLTTWLGQIITDHGDRILPADIAIARRWGRRCQAVGYKGTDLLIAATALEHGLVVATRNQRHFRDAGVDIVNPYEPK